MTLGSTLVVLVGPDALGNRCPPLRHVARLGGKLVNRLLLDKIRRMRARVLDELLDAFGILEHRAGTQMIVVEGLAMIVAHEQRRTQRIEQAHVMDVDVGVVNEHAGLHVSIGIDVQIAPAAGNASTDELAIVLKVEGQKRFLVTHSMIEFVEHLALFGRGHELGRRVLANGHVGKDPGEEDALADEPVVILLGADRLGVLTRIANRDAEGHATRFEQVHGLVDRLVDPLATTGIGGLLAALCRDDRHEVLHTGDLLDELLVDERGVGEAEKSGIRVRLAELDEVGLAHERLTARVDEDVRPELVCLVDDRVDVVIAQVELMAVLRRPATRAMQVAGARGVEQHGPGDVALVFLACFLLLVPGNKVCLGQEALEQTRGDIRVKIGNAADELIPVVALLDCLVEGLAL